MVALDFPPCQSPGVQRTLKFCEYLPNYGWQPIVLSANSFIYNNVDHDIKIPDWLENNTYRTFGFNSVKHFSIRGKYFLATALPDSYITWYWHSVIVGRKIIDKCKPDILWSTHPCLTALKIAASLKKYSGLPWVVDFRDPFKGYHLNTAVNKSGQNIDIEAVLNADLIVFATERMADLYKNQYPNIDHSKFIVIENGYNEEIFTLIEGNKDCVNSDIKDKDSFCLLHSGEIYANGRDPTSLFKAIKTYINSTPGHKNKLKIVFRGAKYNQSMIDILSSMGIDNIVEFLPPVNYIQSIQEMMDADGLIVIQGESFNTQVPGKVYEYLRAKKPILAIVDKKGATADLLNNIQHAYIADINNENEIIENLLMVQSSFVDNDFYYYNYNREKRSKDLANYLDKLLSY
jgi:hypothetical protein